MMSPPYSTSSPRKRRGGLSAALPEGAAMTRTQFDSMQELVEFITDDDGHIDESAADEVFQYLTQLQGEARHLREGLKVSNGRLEGMKQKMMQKQRENSYSDGRQYYKSLLPLFADKRRASGSSASRWTCWSAANGPRGSVRKRRKAMRGRGHGRIPTGSSTRWHPHTSAPARWWP